MALRVHHSPRMTKLATIDPRSLGAVRGGIVGGPGVADECLLKAQQDEGKHWLVRAFNMAVCRVGQNPLVLH